MATETTSYKSESFIYSLCAAGSLGSFIFGYCMGVFNTSFNYIAAVHGWKGGDKDLYESLLAAFVPLGAAIGALVSGAFSSHFGRRGTFIAIDIITIIGVIPTQFSSIYWVLLGRLITGFCIGVNSSAVPLYISEVSPKEIRGSTGTIHQLFITVSATTSYLMGFGLPSERADHTGFETLDSQWWRFMLAFPILICLTRIALMMTVFQFETPNYLNQKGQIAEAKKVLGLIYHKQHVENQLNALQDFRGSSSSSFSEVFSPANRGAVIVGCALSAFQQFSGINCVTFYSNKIFKGSKTNPLSDEMATFYSVMMGFLLFVSALFSGTIIEKQGRKKLLLTGGAAMVVSLAALIVCNMMEFEGIARLCILLYVTAFGFSWGPVVWVMIGEMLNENGVAIATLSNWLCCIFVVQTLPFIDTSSFGINGAFFIYMTFTIASLAYLSGFVPETKGMSKAEIQNLFAAGPGATKQTSLPL